MYKWLAFLILFFLLGGAAYYLSIFRVKKNFYEVDPGKFYRSAQLTGQEIEEIVQKYKIKTIINLRGTHPDQSWFRDEQEVVNKHNLTNVNIGMSSDHVPHKRNIIRYLYALQTSPRPILVHCRVGADRTGEATAIYAMEYMGYSKEKALEFLSPQYLHWESFKPAKRFFINDYQSEDWAYFIYNPCEERYSDIYEQDVFCRNAIVYCCRESLFQPLQVSRYEFVSKYFTSIDWCFHKGQTFIDRPWCVSNRNPRVYCSQSI